MDWLESLILGVVQGLTEFLPVSSDGHLTITADPRSPGSTGDGRSGAENLFFDVMLHLGTLAAILVHYREQVAWPAARGLLGSARRAGRLSAAAPSIRIGLLAVVATLPLIPDALFLKDWIEEAFESLTAAGVGFLITAAVLLLTAAAARGATKGPDETTWLDALLDRASPRCSPRLPGVSRSGLTIAAALALGFSRTWAVGFSLLMAVPAILGAAVFELKEASTRPPSPPTAWPRPSPPRSSPGWSAIAAIVWLVRVVRSGRLWYFSVYLVVLGTASSWPAGGRSRGGGPDARESPALDRPVRGGVADRALERVAGRAAASGSCRRPLARDQVPSAWWRPASGDRPGSGSGAGTTSGGRSGAASREGPAGLSPRRRACGAAARRSHGPAAPAPLNLTATVADTARLPPPAPRPDRRLDPSRAGPGRRAAAPAGGRRRRGVGRLRPLPGDPQAARRRGPRGVRRLGLADPPRRTRRPTSAGYGLVTILDPWPDHRPPGGPWSTSCDRGRVVLVTLPFDADADLADPYAGAASRSATGSWTGVRRGRP